jgi:hypothetical protein
MSTLKTVNIQHPSSSTPAITLDYSGAMTGSFPSPNRNLLYNGAMQVHQRGTSVAIVPNGYQTVDRWEQAATNTTSVYTQSVENDAPTGSGFRKSLKMLCTTANTSPAAGAQRTIRQKLEGQDLQRIAKGTAAAQQLTLSFWVKSNVTGTYICELYDNDNTRQTSAGYTINASGEWEKKVITFAADTTGSFDNDNALSLFCFFGLESGADFTSGSLQSSWTSAVSANRYVGQTNLAAATNNYWQVTGVQLEVGAAATPFEFKSYGQELAECQRYYERYTASNSGFPQAPASPDISNRFECMVMYSEKRANPTITLVGGMSGIALTNSSVFTSTTMGTYVGTGMRTANLFFPTTGATQWVPTHCILSTGQYLEISAEL